MAGPGAGGALGRPDLLEKVGSYGGLAILPATAMAGATASLNEIHLVPERRKIMADIRADLFAWLDKKGYSFIPSHANIVMIERKRPGRGTAAASLNTTVAIGQGC